MCCSAPPRKRFVSPLCPTYLLFPLVPLPAIPYHHHQMTKRKLQSTWVLFVSNQLHSVIFLPEHFFSPRPCHHHSSSISILLSGATTLSLIVYKNRLHSCINNTVSILTNSNSCCFHIEYCIALKCGVGRGCMSFRLLCSLPINCLQRLALPPPINPPRRM